MSECSWFRFLYLAFFSQPAADRVLYRGLRRWPCRSIVEIGLGDGQRAERLIQVARRYAPAGGVRYTGIDLFEARPQHLPPLSLKQAYQRLNVPGLRLQLVPGDPFQALVRVANTLRDTDLIVIGPHQDTASLEQAWFYVPRMLSESSRVYCQQTASDGSVVFELLPRLEIERRANPRRAAAA